MTLQKFLDDVNIFMNRRNITGPPASGGEQGGRRGHREEAHCSGLAVASLEAWLDPALGLVSSLASMATSLKVPSSLIPERSSPQGLVPPPVLGDVAGQGDAGANTSRAETFIPGREGSSSEGGTPMRCGILASIFGEASSCPSNEEIFR
ncbi:hypothetical protein ACLOJK_008567 [Asimina triloba]